MSATRVTVIGLSGAALAEAALGALARAGLVVGGRRHLGAVRHLLPARAATHVLDADVPAALDMIAAASDDVVVLASGDPGFFGIVRALAERFGSERLQVLPAASSVAQAFARVGLPWDDAVVVSAHGREPVTAINACRAHPKVAVLTAPRFGPAELAAALIGSARRFVVAERLGSDGERVTTGSAADIAAGDFTDPNVVLVIDRERAVGPRGQLWPPAAAEGGWALPETAFSHRDGMITKSEVRAVALAWLGPRLGDLMWDVGAGSGAVGVECARLGAAVVAVDSDADQCRRVAANARRHGVEVRVVHGRAPQALAELPDPDTVFVGGGGHLLTEIVRSAAQHARRAVVVALATLERVGPAQRALHEAGLAVQGTALQAARLAPLGDGTRLAAANPVFLLRGQRP